MKKRLTIAALCFLAGLAVLLFLLKGPFAPMDWASGPQSGGSSVAMDATSAPAQSPSPNPSPNGKTPPSPDPVSIEFDGVALPDVLNQLVKQAGITVTADLDDIHWRTLVTIQAFVPPLEALKMVAEGYELEVLEMESGWWIRPVSYITHVIYQPSGLNEERGKKLIQTLRELLEPARVPAGDIAVTEFSSPPALMAAPAAPLTGAESITMDEAGIHVKANKQRQQMIAAYLDVYFRGPVPSKSGEAAPGIPPLQQQ